MKFKLNFDCDNEAFGYEPTYEIARILREVADKLKKHNADSGYVHDENGNLIGDYILED